MTSANVSLKEILTELHTLHSQKATGILYITTDTNKSAQIIMDGGEIVFVYFASKLGEKAIELLANSNSGRYRFQSGTFSGRTPLPPTLTILQILGGEDVSASGQAVTNVPEVPVFGDSEIALISTTLATYVGPLAGFLCNDHLKTAKSLEEGIDLLASEIPSAQQADEFKKTVLEQLG